VHGTLDSGLVCCTLIYRVGQNHIYTVCIRCFWQGNHHIYGHIRCIYTVLANPTYLWCHAPFSTLRYLKKRSNGVQMNTRRWEPCYDSMSVRNSGSVSVPVSESERVSVVISESVNVGVL